jgi:hypothetical protein
MKNAFEPSLFDRQHPRQVSCVGVRLLSVLAELKQQGAIALGMACHRPGHYTLALDWPDAAQANVTRTAAIGNEKPVQSELHGQGKAGLAG